MLSARNQDQNNIYDGKLTVSDKMQILRDNQLDNAPVKVLPLATKLGLSVFYATSWDSDGLSGMIIKDQNSGPSGFTIYVNRKHSEVRRRFSIAHEIAHYILHEDRIGDGIADDALYRSGLTNKIETEANNLAAEILMPWTLINKAMDNGYNTIESLARLFEVSKSAMAIRLGVPYEF